MSKRRAIPVVHLARSAAYVAGEDGSICYGGRYSKPVSTDPDAVTCRACRNSGAWQRVKMRARDAERAVRQAALQSARQESPGGEG